MKDILIKGVRLKKEIIFWLASFIAAMAMNVYAIIKYNTRWSELFSQLHIIIILSVVIYIIILPLRGVYYLVKLQIIKKKQ